MTLATQKLTFAEYLTYTNGTDVRYELVDGELIPKLMGTGKHGGIAEFLNDEFLNDEFRDQIRQNHLSWTSKQMTVGVRSPRGTRWDTSRIPDVTVMELAQWEAMADREAVIDFNEPPPYLVVEVVSESTKIDDYRSKRSEYALLEISEYWIVDPLTFKVTICLLDHRLYDCSEFLQDEQVKSPTFPALNLTVAQIIKGKR